MNNGIDLDDVLSMLHSQQEHIFVPDDEMIEQLISIPIKEEIKSDVTLFDINKFSEHIIKNNINDKLNRLDYSKNITGGDIAQCCPRETLFRLGGINYTNLNKMWHAVAIKCVIGTAIHEFIQNSPYNVFTELETVVKVPSINISGRVDGIINNDVLVEIKSCPYKDFSSIVNNNKYRDKDFTQVVLYKYLLENHLDEINTIDNNYNKPKFDKYKFKKIQMIYIANDLISDDMVNISSSYKIVETLKVKLNSKSNPFWFITTVIIDVEENFELISKLEDKIKRKIGLINESLTHNRNNVNKIYPPKSNEFVQEYVNSGYCFSFCLYNNHCWKTT